MRLYEAMLKTQRDSGWMAVSFKDHVYYLNPYGGNIKDGCFDLRTGIGSFGEFCLNPDHIESDQFEPADLPNREQHLKKIEEELDERATDG